MNNYFRTLVVVDQVGKTSGPVEVKCTADLVENYGQPVTFNASFYAACEAIDAIAGREIDGEKYKVFVIHKNELIPFMKEQLERNNLEYTFINASNVLANIEWKRELFQIHEAIVEAKACDTSYMLMIGTQDGE